MVDCKDIKLEESGDSKSSQLFEIRHGSVQISSSEFTDIDATSGLTAAGQQSLKCEELTLKTLKLRKSVMHLKGDDVVLKGVKIEAVAINPLANAQLFQFHADQLDSSTLALTGFTVTDLKDTELTKSSDVLSTQFLNLKSHTMTLTNVAFADIDATSGIAVDAKAKVDVSTLTWSGVNNFRKSVIDMVGDSIRLAESSLDNLNVDPLGPAGSKDPAILF